MRTSVSDHHTARLTAGMASLGAGAIHVAVVTDHLTTWWVSGLFFLLLGSFQLLWAPVVAFTTSRFVLVAGGLISAGSIALWAGTRIWGQPVGPRAGTPLPVGTSGVIASVLELTLIVCVLWALGARASRHRRGVAASSLGVACAAVLALTVPGVSAALEHDHGAHADQGGHHQVPGGAEGGHHDGPGTSNSERPGGAHEGAHGDDHGERSPSPGPTRPDSSDSPSGDGDHHGSHSH